MPIYADKLHLTDRAKTVSEIFVDRHSIIRKYAGLMNEAHVPEKIMFLHGVGGIGKSSLMRFLARACSKRVADWDRLEKLDDGSFADEFPRLKNLGTVPVARLDFGAAPHREDRPQEAFSALFILKRQLASQGLSFPRFDFAALNYLHKTGQNLTTSLADLFPRKELTLASDLVDFLSELPLLRTLRSVVDIADVRSDHRLTRAAFARGLENDFVVSVLEREAEPHLFDDLPAFFADDVNDWLQAVEGRRVVLFFDSFEALWGSERAERFSELCGMHEYRDLWIRCLIGRLALEHGAIPVFAGRDSPVWDRASRYPIPSSFVDAIALEAFDEQDALRHLDAAGVDDTQTRVRILQRACDTDRTFHPDLLALCIEEEQLQRQYPTSQDAPGVSLNVYRAVTKRLLSYVDPMLERLIITLSVARWFDWELAQDYGNKFGEAVELSAFERIVSFSFVSPIIPSSSSGSELEETQQQRFEAHRALRSSIRRVRQDDVAAIHRRFCKLFECRREKGNFSDELEFLYHLLASGHSGAEAEWCASVDYALETERLRELRSLLDVLRDLPEDSVSQSDRALLRLGRALIGLSKVDQAKNLCEMFEDAAYCRLLMGEVEFGLGNMLGAQEILEEGGDDVPSEIYGLTAFRMAELDLFLGNLAQAEAACRRGRASGHGVSAEKWEILLAEIRLFHGDLEAAATLLQKSIGTLQGMRARNRNLPTLGKALGSLGLICETRRRWQEAREWHEQALSLRRVSGDIRGVAASLHGLGKALAGEGHAKNAEEAFSRAMAGARDIGDKLLGAKVQHSFGLLRLRMGERERACESFASALRTFRSSGTHFDVLHLMLSAHDSFTADETAAIGIDPFAETLRQVQESCFGVFHHLFPETLSDHANENL